MTLKIIVVDVQSKFSLKFQKVQRQLGIK